MKIALLLPPLENKVKYFTGWQLNVSDYGTFPPLGLLYIATVLKEQVKDVEVRIFDCPAQKIGYPELKTILENYAPDVVGMTVFTMCLVDVLKVACLAKSVNKNTHICVGGPHLFIYPRQTLEYPDVDSIIVGEGESAFVELIKQLKTRQTTSNIKGLYFKADRAKTDFPKAVIENLDELPYFDTDFINKSIYYSTVGRQRNVITLLTARGCPYQCTFCDVPYKYFRGRSIENILGEIKLRLKEGYKEIFFYDDTFNITPGRVIDLSKRIIEEGLKFEWSFRGRVNSVTFEMLEAARQAGCQRIHFGIETGTDEGLMQLKKGITVEQIKNAISWCRKLKVRTIGDFIIGLPFEKSKEDVLNNVDRLIGFFVDYAQFNFLQPIPGSEIYESGMKNGVIDPAKWEGFVRNPHPDFQPPLWTEYLKREDIANLLYLAYQRFYVRPAYILKEFFSLTSFHEFKRVLTGGVKILFKK